MSRAPRPKIEALDPPWWRVVDAALGFEVALPGEPTERGAVERTGVGPVAIRGVGSEHEGVAYLAAASKVPGRGDLDDYARLLDAPFDRLVVGGRRRRLLGESSAARWQDPSGPRETSFALPLRRDGVRRIARRRWLERQGHLYQALAVLPEGRADDPAIARFLGSLAVVPVAPDRRGLTPAWRPRVARDHGFAVLWPERLDDGFLHARTSDFGRVGGLTFFAVDLRLGFTVAVRDHDPPLDPAALVADLRAEFLAAHAARLLDERPALEPGGLVGSRFRAEVVGPPPAEPPALRPRPPGPGTHALGRIVAGRHRAWLLAATLPDDRPHPGVEAFLASFRRLDVPEHHRPV